MASVYIDIDLNDIRTYELIEELDTRSLCLSNSDKADLLDIIKEVDSEKWKWFLAIKDKYSLFELQEIINTGEPVRPSKEQLPIPFDNHQSQ